MHDFNGSDVSTFWGFAAMIAVSIGNGLFQWLRDRRKHHFEMEKMRWEAAQHSDLLVKIDAGNEMTARTLVKTAEMAGETVDQVLGEPEVLKKTNDALDRVLSFHLEKAREADSANKEAAGQVQGIQGIQGSPSNSGAAEGKAQRNRSSYL